jgi:hypothetical protein
MLEVAGERYDASPHYGPCSVGEVVLPLMIWNLAECVRRA